MKEYFGEKEEYRQLLQHGNTSIHDKSGATGPKCCKVAGERGWSLLCEAGCVCGAQREVGRGNRLSKGQTRSTEFLGDRYRTSRGDG